jgi:predicted Zn-dependent protease
MKSIRLFFFLFIILAFGCKKDPSSLFKKTHTLTPRDFLSDSEYKKLIVQIAYVPGHEPTTVAINHLTAFLKQCLNKPSGIQISYTSVGSLNKASLTLTDIKDIEKANRKSIISDNTISMYIFFADADYFENEGASQVLGLAYGASSMVVFEKTIRDYAGGITQPSASTLEASVSEHEVGHILGLVNNGTAMVGVHEGGPSGKHCSNSNCLMYYTTETSDIVSNLVGNTIPSLDNDCMNDLKANGGK